MTRTLSLVLALGLAAAAAPVLAHHSSAMFDAKQTIKVDAVVTEFRWTNPHSFMHVNIASAGGASENWAIEMTSPNNLVLHGWRRSSLKAGDKVKLEYHPLRNGLKGGQLVQVTLADGTVLTNI